MHNLFQSYSRYREPSITNRFIKHKHVLDLLSKIESNTLFTTKNVGNSFQGRSLNLVKSGSGETRILIWSQMHGDEATATMVLFDLLLFLSADDEYNTIRQTILNKCTLYILPMVNPDGAECLTRRNAQGIDINRDFLAQQTPEGKILRDIHQKINPHFAFNMHDQTNIWSAGKTGNPATISVLAPAFDNSQRFNSSRESAAKVITVINSEIQNHISGCVGRWSDDDYEIRAFGDNFQTAGSATILLEAGGHKNDPEKQFVRKLTFLALLTGLNAIANNLYASQTVDGYLVIPTNEKRHFDILLRNCVVEAPEYSYQIDIGLVADEQVDANGSSVSYVYEVANTGDLQGFFGYEEIDASNYKLIQTRHILIDDNADFILQDKLTTLLCVENGCITSKNF